MTFRILDCIVWSALVINEQIIWTHVDGSWSCVIWGTTTGFSDETEKGHETLSQIKSHSLFSLNNIYLYKCITASTTFLPVYVH